MFFQTSQKSSGLIPLCKEDKKSTLKNQLTQIFEQLPKIRMIILILAALKKEGNIFVLTKTTLIGFQLVKPSWRSSLTTQQTLITKLNLICFVKHIFYTDVICLMRFFPDMHTCIHCLEIIGCHFKSTIMVMSSKNHCVGWKQKEISRWC